MHARINHSLAALALGGAVLSCASQASTICSVECDCEHCSDIEEEVVCRARERDAEVADGYGCLHKWEVWAACYKDKGTCHETEARYSTVTQTPGSCSGEESLGRPCLLGDQNCDVLGPTA